MTTELQTADPYTLVAHHLQQGEATRVGLVSMTGLDPELIDAVLYRFYEVNESVSCRKDSRGLEFFRWKNGAEPPTAQPHNPNPSLTCVDCGKPRSAGSAERCRACYEGRAAADKKVQEIVEKGKPLEKPHATLKDFSVVAETRKAVNDLEEGDEISTREIYDALMKDWPNATERYSAGELRSQIAVALNAIFKQGNLEIAVRSNGGNPHVYRRVDPDRKGPICSSCRRNRVEGSGSLCWDCDLNNATSAASAVDESFEKVSVSNPARPQVRHGAVPRELDYQKILELRSTGMAIQKISQTLGYSYSTLSNRRAKDKRLDEVLDEGWARYCQTPDESLSESSRDVDEDLTSEETESSQSLQIQLVEPDKSPDKSEYPKPSNFITNNQAQDGRYALPAFIAELRSERDELDQLIALLERRMLRGGGIGGSEQT